MIVVIFLLRQFTVYYAMERLSSSSLLTGKQTPSLAVSFLTLHPRHKRSPLQIITQDPGGISYSSTTYLRDYVLRSSIDLQYWDSNIRALEKELIRDLDLARLAGRKLSNLQRKPWTSR
jgi:hypothetical protein